MEKYPIGKRSLDSNNNILSTTAYLYSPNAIYLYMRPIAERTNDLRRDWKRIHVIQIRDSFSFLPFFYSQPSNILFRMKNVDYFSTYSQIVRSFGHIFVNIHSEMFFIRLCSNILRYGETQWVAYTSRVNACPSDR